MLRALQQGRDAEAAAIRERYLPLEDLRDSINPIRVLHDAVALAGIAATGPLQPMLSNLDEGDRERVALAAQTLLAGEKDFA